MKTQSCINTKFVLSFLFSILLFLFLYHTTSLWLIDLWYHDKPYSHGFFIPFITLYLVWIKREQVSRLPVVPCWGIGGIVILSCCIFLLLGRVGAIIQLEIISLYFIFSGVILFLWGWSVWRALFFALFYLQFMIPWTDVFLPYVYPVFRLISATLAAWFLGFLYPVLQDHTFIALPDITLSVVNACAGVNFINSVIAIGLILAYLTQKSWIRVTAVLIVGIVVTILANGVRIAIAGVMGQEYGADMLHGPGHVLRGWLVAQVGWVGVFLANWLVAKIPHPSKYYLYERWKTKSKVLTGQVEEEKSEAKKFPAVILAVFLVCFGVYLNFFSLPRKIDLSAQLNSVPMQIGSWQGVDISWFESEKYYPGVDQELLRTYHTPSGQPVFLYIGYFANQTVDARLVSYRSRFLFKGKEELGIAVGNNERLVVNFSRPNVESESYELLSWYQFEDGELTDSREVKIKGVTSALINHKNNGAVILVATRGDGEEGDDGIPDDLVAFSQLVAPVVKGIFERSL